MSAGPFALSFAAAFAGASLYCNLVEQPARMSLDENSMMKEWKPSDQRGFLLLGALALLSAIAAFLTFGDNHDIRWLAGALVILGSWLYAYFVVTPLNNRLLAMETPAADDNARGLLREWGWLEWGQSLLGVCATGVFAWALS